METFFEWFWWIFGGILVLAEFLLPGLVVVFIGLGALTVATLQYFGYIEGILPQFLTWFISSIVYCFTLRLLVIKLYPSDTEKQNVNEDLEVFGSIVEVSEEIPVEGTGRIFHSDSTWPAKSNSKELILKGEKVKIVERNNLTWIVEKIK